MSSVADVRTLFEAKIKEQQEAGSPQTFHPADLERVKNDAYLQRYLNHHDKNAQAAANMLWEVLVWRNSMGANDLNETNINMEYINEGAFYPHGRDIDGSLLLIFHCKMHIKGQKDHEELKKCIIYWFDRIERQENGKPITFVFDMESCGVSNMDMEFTKFLINLTKYYYPSFLNYIIIYEMPWILSGPFKVIKKLLPARAASKMMFLSKSNLSELVAPEQTLTSWGGQSEYKFEFVPEIKEPQTNDQTPKKVTFAEQGDFQHSLGEMLQISPSETIVFKAEGDELTGKFTITNMDESPVSFKIRTTSAEKFRVRPSLGSLANKSSLPVVVTVQPGVNLKTISKEKFLVMCVQVPKVNLTQQELAEVWQKTTGSKIDEYRLKCVFSEKEVASLIKTNNIGEIMDKDKQLSHLLSTTESLQTSVANIDKQINAMKRLQVANLILSVFALFFGMVSWLLLNDIKYENVIDSFPL